VGAPSFPSLSTLALAPASAGAPPPASALRARLAGAFASAAAPASVDGGALLTATFAAPAALAFAPDGRLFVADSASGALRVLSGAGADLCDGRWHLLAKTYAGGPAGALTTYVDGVAVARAAPAQPLAVNTAAGGGVSGGLRLAWNGNLSIAGGALFGGTLGEARAYARELSAAEVAALAVPPVAALFPTAVVQPAPAPDIAAYTLLCAPGSEPVGAAPSVFARQADNSWAVAPPFNCAPCASGMYNAVAGAACAGTPCSPGSAGPLGSKIAANATCAACVSGTYAASAGLGACVGTPCPAGYVGALSSTSSYLAGCTPCRPGEWSTASGLSVCQGGKYAKRAPPNPSTHPLHFR
jgi:hypothetical protein